MQCTAKSKRTGERCKRMATKGMRVCRVHGGVPTSGAPKGNKNALKCGQFETITRETMFDDEIEYADSVNLDPVKMLEEQIRVLRVKERRLAIRMKNALVAEQDAGKEGDDGKKKPSTVMLTVSTTQTQNFDGATSKTVTSNSETHAMYYLRLEAAHTQVMEQIRRASDNLVRLRAEQGGDDEAPSSIMVQIVDGRRTKEDGNTETAGLGE